LLVQRLLILLEQAHGGLPQRQLIISSVTISKAGSRHGPQKDRFYLDRHPVDSRPSGHLMLLAQPRWTRYRPRHAFLGRHAAL